VTVRKAVKSSPAGPPADLETASGGQQLLGGPEVSVPDRVVFADSGTDTGVLAVRVALTVRDST
jgi:hypothetical protein